MQLLVETIIAGILIGGVYIICSIGLSIAFGVLDIVDLAVGMWIVGGAYLAFSLSNTIGIPYWYLIIIVPFIMFVIGWLIAPLIYRVNKSDYALPALMAITFTFGIQIAIRGGLLGVYGYNPILLAVDNIPSSINIFDIYLPTIRVIGFLIAVAIALCALLLLKYTKIGLGIRAMAENEASAELMGMNTKKLSSIVFGVYVAISSIAGVILGAIYSTNPDLGLKYTLFAFFVVVLGGLGSMLGVIIASLALGIIQSMITSYVGADYSLLVVFVLLFITMLFIPNGIVTKWAK